MFASNQYVLLDFGDGRKLERFGSLFLDRPSPAAANVERTNPSLWEDVAARFVPVDGSASSGCGPRGRWIERVPVPADWIVEHAPLRFELRNCDSGHVGLFPEQAENWDWIARQVSAIRAHDDDFRPRVLNLFAYTGASTLAAAAAGADVVHVDAAKSTVAWARRNAALSGLADAPIRWIAEDAPRFVAREQKRGNRYHGIILDPPSYGHGPAGQLWQIDRDLPDLLDPRN
jgi:23S rRNA (cytosine1962-C5)-methyltransferase